MIIFFIFKFDMRTIISTERMAAMNAKAKEEKNTAINLQSVCVDWILHIKCEFTSFSKLSWFKWIFPEKSHSKMGGISRDESVKYEQQLMNGRMPLICIFTEYHLATVDPIRALLLFFSSMKIMSL